eukprot:4851031-Amphidinium_carterae.1
MDSSSLQRTAEWLIRVRHRMSWTQFMKTSALRWGPLPPHKLAKPPHSWHTHPNPQFSEKSPKKTVKCKNSVKGAFFQEGKSPGIGKPRNPPKYPRTLRNKAKNDLN